MYDDYMQNLLEGGCSPYQYTYEPMARNTNFYDQTDDYFQFNYDLNYPYNYIQQNFSSRNLVTEIENLYPEIYKIIYPMIQKACAQNIRPITEDVLDEMTDDIYNHIEADNIVNLNINIENNRAENKNLSNTQKTNIENNREYRQINSSIRDLIRILLIRELIGRPASNRPPRPFPPRPPRPGHYSPFPPRPRF